MLVKCASAAVEAEAADGPTAASGKGSVTCDCAVLRLSTGVGAAVVAARPRGGGLSSSTALLAVGPPPPASSCEGG